MFYEERSGGLSHGEERWVLPSKSTTYCKLIKRLEIVPDSGEIVREVDIWHISICTEESGVEPKAKSGTEQIRGQID